MRNPDDLPAEFRERVLNTDSWVSSAEDLVAAASLLEPAVDEAWRSGSERPPGRWKPLNDEIRAEFFMLYSYAIENLLKAHLVVRRRAEVEKSIDHRGRLPKFFRRHDLYKLACDAGFEELAIKHELLIHRLSRAAVWYGRYPVPLSSKDLKTGRKSPNLAPLKAGLWGYNYTDVADAKEIVRELKAGLTV